MKRFFFFSANFYTSATKIEIQCFGTEREGFPTINDLKAVVIESRPLASDIVILSICEIASKEDYIRFWGDQYKPVPETNIQKQANDPS